jgi:arginine utilization regulatory protein
MAENEHVLSHRLLQMPMDFDEIGEDVEKWDRRGPLPEHMANVEKEIIRETMMDCGGNISKTAELLQIKRQTLQHKLRKYGLKE